MALWTPILSAARATDWTLAGVEGGIPTTRTKYNYTGTGNDGNGRIAAYTGTAARINSALSSAPSGTYVELAAGTFNLSSSIVMVSNKTLRGQGMTTIINFTGLSGSGWYWGDSIGVAFVGNFPTRSDTDPSLAGVPSSQINWTGTGGNNGVYTQNATVLDLASNPTCVAGDTLVLWQTMDPDASVPNTGFFVSKKNGAASSVCWEGDYDSQNTGQEQRVRVVSVSTSHVTIAGGIKHPTGTWRTARTPKAGWFPVANTIHDAGIETLLLRTTNYQQAHYAVIGMAWAVNCWVKGVALQPYYTYFHGKDNGDPACEYGIQTVDSRNLTITNNWIDKMIGGGTNTTTSYGIGLKATHDSLIQNNVLQNVESPCETLTNSAGNVIAYNYEHYVGDDSQEGGFQVHAPGGAMNLYEGNSWTKMWLDFFHGNTNLHTFFRNYGDGQGVSAASYHRWINFIGNAISASVYKSLATDSTKYARWDSVGFHLGYPQQNASSATVNGVAYDPLVWTTAMLWGNYCSTGGTRWLSAEVPTGDATFPNSVPASQTLPASFYRSSRPGFFTISGIGTLPWPLIGPDVTGGNLLNGYANKTPAQRVYESQGTIASFNPSVYGSDSESSPPVGTPILSVR